MRILALDIATCTGYSLLTEVGLEAYGNIQLKPKDEHREKFNMFKKEITNLIKIHNPTTVILEGVFQGQNAKTTAYLNQLRGIAIVSVPNKIKLLTVSVSTVRKEVMGKGKKHSKEDVFLYVSSKYKLKDLNFEDHNDISDSILLAEYALKIPY